MKTFAGRVAVITGAASGLGSAFALTGGKLGMRLVLADVQKAELDRTVAVLRAQGIDAIGVQSDVSKSADVQALADAAVDAFGTVHLVFNNAGVSAGGLVWENTEKDWDWVLGVNLQGVINGVRVFTPLMLEAARQDPSYEGHVVNTASMAGLRVGSAMGIYSVSKYAVMALSEALHQDLSLVTQQVNASVLCPSYVPTGIGQSDKARPTALVNGTPLTRSQQVAREISQSSIATGSATAADVSELTYQALRDNQFYIFPHPQALPLVQQRLENILAQKNPADVPDASPAHQARREQLRAALRA